MGANLTDKPFFDEMLGSSSETPNSLRAPYNKLQNWLDNQKLSQLRRQSDRAQDIFRSVGITFNVYGDGDGVGACDGDGLALPVSGSEPAHAVLVASEWRAWLLLRDAEYRGRGGLLLS